MSDSNWIQQQVLESTFCSALHDDDYSRALEIGRELGREWIEDEMKAFLEQEERAEKFEIDASKITLMRQKFSHIALKLMHEENLFW